MSSRKLDDILAVKQATVQLTRDDLVDEVETDNWRKLHLLGPVHVKLVCKLCGATLADDLPEFGWLNNTSYWNQHLAPHLVSHV